MTRVPSWLLGTYSLESASLVFYVVFPGGLPINDTAPESASGDLMNTILVHMWNCQNVSSSGG